VVSTQDGRVGAAEGLDRNVRVTDENQVDVWMSDDPQEPGRGGGELLGIVDDDQGQARGQALNRLGVRLEQIGSRAQDGRRVVGTRPRQCRDLVVLGQNLCSGNPFGSIVSSSQCRETTSVKAALDRSHEKIPQLGAEPSGGQCVLHVRGPVRSLALAAGVTGQELAQDDILLRSAQKPGVGVPAQSSGLAQDAETKRLVSPGQWFGGGATDPGSDAFAQISGRGPGSCQDQALIRRDPVAADPVDHDLDGG